jgi:hypothetical protein
MQYSQNKEGKKIFFYVVWQVYTIFLSFLKNKEGKIFRLKRILQIYIGKRSLIKKRDRDQIEKKNIILF